MEPGRSLQNREDAMIITILLVIALICFLLAAANVSVPPINWLALGAVFITMTLLIPGLHQ